MYVFRVHPNKLLFFDNLTNYANLKHMYVQK